MIINTSRAKGFQTCREKERLTNEVGLVSLQEAEPLLTGAATHLGFANLLSGKDVGTAQREAEALLRERMAQQVLLPEEVELYNKRILFVKAATREYHKKLPSEGYQVLMPEVNFCVALRSTEHHCWYCHKLLYPEAPFESCGYQNDAPDIDYCQQPHFFKGRTDAVVKWEGMIWLLEHKTSSDNKDIFWKKWFLDTQVTGYIYGIWKSTGIRPAGVILNKIYKPNKRQDPENVTIEREAYLRSDSDLERFERQISQQASDYENAMRLGETYLNTDSCILWNRTCDFHKVCLDHGRFDPSAFRKKPMDYVEEEYYKLLNLPLPEGAKIENQEVQNDD